MILRRLKKTKGYSGDEVQKKCLIHMGEANSRKALLMQK